MARLFVAVVSILLANSTALALTITLNPGTYSGSWVRSYAYGGATTPIDTFYLAALPFIDHHLVPAGNSSSYADYDLSNVSFQITIDHARDTMQYANAISDGNIFFTVDEDVDYVMDGVYTASDADGRAILQMAWLYDLTDYYMVFDVRQESRSTANESFTLGLQEGDYSNEATGPLTGTLLAGHSYQLWYQAYIYAVPDASASPATAGGYFRMTFVPQPEPLVVDIDVKPGSDRNKVVARPYSIIKVAVLGSDTVDATLVAPDSLAFGPDDASILDLTCVLDANDDGMDDLIASFFYGETGLPLGESEACLAGLIDGVPFEGCDTVTVTRPRCGLGVEVTLLLPPLMWLWRRRRA